MLDRILVLFSLAALMAFCGIVVWYIHEPDLTVVMIVVLFIAFYDFWISVFRTKNNNADSDSS